MNSKVVNIIEKDVIRVLRLSNEAVFELKMNEGIHFVRDFEPKLREALINSRAYWNWFRSVWANRDKMLMASIIVFSKGFKEVSEVNDAPMGWELHKCHLWNESQEFYNDYHHHALAGVDMYPNDEVIKAALNHQLVS
jgi:hypothetical protein